MKKKYIKPEFSIATYHTQDILTVSVALGDKFMNGENLVYINKMKNTVNY